MFLCRFMNQFYKLEDEFYSNNKEDKIMERIQLKPDKKLLVKLFLIVSTISLLILFLLLIIQTFVPFRFTRGLHPMIILWLVFGGAIILFWVISTPLIFLWVKNLSYSIDEERITIYKGIITKIQQNIPYRAITDFMLHRSLYDRFLGIGSLRIQTAGQSVTPSGYEANMSGLIEWEKLLAELRARVKKNNESIQQADETPIELINSTQLMREMVIELQNIRKLLEQKNIN